MGFDCFISYYDYQLNKARRKFADQVLTFNLCYCHRQLASFQEATSGSLTSLAVKRAKLVGKLKASKVAHGNTVITNPKLRQQSAVAPYSTDNCGLT